MLKGRKRLVLVAGGLVALFVAPMILAMLLPPPSYYVTGDPLDIKLYGIEPGDSRDIFDPAGRRIGETFASRRVWWVYTWSTPGSVSRTYIFDVPKSDDEITFERLAVARSSGVSQSPLMARVERGGDSNGVPDDRRLYYSLYSLSILRFQDTPLISVPSLPFLSRLFRNHLESVDITLRYWQGPRGKADVTFIGPFAAGKTFTPDGGVPGSLVISNYYGIGDEWGVRGLFTAAAQLGDLSDVLVYDKTGKRRQAQTGAARNAPTEVFLAFTVAHANAEDITAITIGEKKRERTFHRVPFEIPGVKERTYPDYLDAVADRLKLGEKERANLGTFRIQSAEQALKTFDLLRGSCAKDAWEMIRPKVESREEREMLAPDDLARVRRAADAWAKADDAEVRGQGIAIGLALSPKEFIPSALSHLEAGASDDNIPYVLDRYSSEFSPDDIARVKELLKKSPQSQFLMQCLTGSSLPEASDALRELARSDATAVWWHALREAKTLVALGTSQSWPAELRVRGFITAQGDEITFSSERAEAARLLPALLTSSLMNADPEAFDGIYRTMVACCDRAVAEPLTVSLLRTAPRFDFPETIPGNHICSLVREINLWNGVNIAGLGSDLNAEVANAHGRNWRQAARDAVEWLDSRKVREEPPEDYRVRTDDLRLVVYEPSEPEMALIAIWAPSPSADEYGRVYVADGPAVRRTYADQSGRVYVVNGPRISVAYSISRTARSKKTLRAAPDYDAQFWGQIHGRVEQSRGLYQSFAPGRLPVDLRFVPDWRVVIERAGSPESVLSGTKAFDEWWKTHGPADPRMQAPQ